ncbi:PREDICTED: uncharacterized protein LOC101315323 [Fragaria vesca subsp. vesca]
MKIWIGICINYPVQLVRIARLSCLSDLYVALVYCSTSSTEWNCICLREWNWMCPGGKANRVAALSVHEAGAERACCIVGNGGLRFPEISVSYDNWIWRKVLMDNNCSPFPQGREPSMEAGDWRGKWPADMRQSVINKIISTLKTACPISGQEGLEELERSAASLEEKSYAAANSQLDYLQKNSQEMVTVVTKPQNTISNSLESNGKGLLVSGSSTAQQNKMNASETIAELLTTIKNTLDQVPLQMQETDQQLQQLELRQLQMHQMQQVHQVRLVGANNVLQANSVPAQQLQQLELRQSQTHQMPHVHQARLVAANNMLQANSVRAQPNYVIVDNQHLKLELEKNMYKNQLQQPHQQLQMQQQWMQKPPQMLQEKENWTNSSAGPHINGGDWQEEVYQKIVVLKEKYYPELHEMYQKIANKLHQLESLDSLMSTPNPNSAKLKMFKTMLERLMAVLQLSKSNISPGLKEKLNVYEKQIINFINTNRPRKPVSSLNLPPSEIHNAHMLQQAKVEPQDGQQCQPHPSQQKYFSEIQPQIGHMQQHQLTLQQHQLSLQQQSNPLQRDMQHRLQASGQVSGAILQPPNTMELQNQLYQSHRSLSETSSSSLDYPAQTGHTDWQEEANQKVMFGNCLLIKWNLINIKHMILDEKEIEGSAWGLNHSVAVGSIYKLICFSNSMRLDDARALPRFAMTDIDLL